MACRIVLLGGPGAGKGTQARRLARSQGWPHVSTGDIFRAHVENGTELGTRIAPYMNSGQLLPDELACEIVAGRLSEPDCADGYILDGFPRSLPQAMGLDALLEARGERLDIAVNIIVPDDEIVQRLTERRTCPECGKIYNLRLRPPVEAGTCDDDGVALVQREDDNEETARDRLRVYHVTTEPVVKFFEIRGLLRSVDGSETPPDDVTIKIEDIIRARNGG